MHPVFMLAGARDDKRHHADSEYDYIRSGERENIQEI